MEENPKPNRLHALAFLEIGLFEIVFVTIFLLLLFGTLNYFNILPVSAVFPNQLGWLPQKEVPAGTSPRQTQQKVIPSPANFTPTTNSSVFTYDVAKAKTLLTQYLKDNIKPAFLPPSFDAITVSQFDQNQSDQNPNSFVLSYATQSADISVFFRNEKAGKIYNTLSISIKLKSDLPAASSAALANSLLSSYFIKPYTISDCNKDPNIILCENFKTVPEGKKGYGVTMFGGISKLPDRLYVCQIPKESVDYLTAKSCAPY